MGLTVLLYAIPLKICSYYFFPVITDWKCSIGTVNAKITASCADCLLYALFAMKSKMIERRIISSHILYFTISHPFQNTNHAGSSPPTQHTNTRMT